MAKSDFEAETRMLLRGTKEDYVRINAARILNEDLNIQILLAIEASEALKKSRPSPRSNHENPGR